ncbi:dynein axonemal assembly factor 4-like [Mytilus trossulus]|uniref:dynein axonemal assembly factor 4-like n=1 Tax=Mytilus trossulus TaxID=6551 RepID=UPI003004DBDF
MPLLIRDYTWEETEKMMFITVPLKGVRANKVDLLSSEEFIKVSFPPYLFECLLHAPVDDQTSTAQIGNGAVVFKLKKQEPGMWYQLSKDEIVDKQLIKQKKEEAIQKNQERAEQNRKDKAEKKRASEKYTVNEMMKIEDEDRMRISNIKESERQKATEDLERWKEEQREMAQEEKQRILEEKMAEEAKKREEERKQRKKKGKNIFEESAEGAPRREVGKIEVKFTKRIFPTAARESQTPQEEEWLQKQADARKALEVEDSDLTEEEKNPLFMRDKANEFFKAGNFQAAVNAYTTALRYSPKMPSLYSNRAACHLKLRNFFKTIEDCSKAIDLLHPPVPQNAASRLKAMVRKGTAFCQLELYVEGLQDYECALKIDPNNEQLKADAEKIRQIIQSSTGS